MNKLFVSTILASAAVSAVSFSSASASGYDSALNQPSYWGDDCVKTEMTGEVMTYTATGNNIIKVVVKGGTENAVYTNGSYTNLTAPINPKSGKPYAISHVIVCYGETTPNTPQNPTPETPTTPDVDGDDDGQITPEDQDTDSSTTTPSTPQVLGASTGKGGTSPEVLPATGSSSLLIMAAGVIASVATYFGLLRRA